MLRDARACVGFQRAWAMLWHATRPLHVRTGNVGRCGRGGEIQKGNKRWIAVLTYSRTQHMRVRETRISGRGTKQSTQQPLDKEREKERCGVQVGRTEIRIKNASRRTLVRRGSNVPTRARDANPWCVCVAREVTPKWRTRVPRTSWLRFSRERDSSS